MKRITRFLGGLNNGLTRIYLLIAMVCVILIVVVIFKVCDGVKNTSLSIVTNEKIDCTPNIVDRMKAIGQWEFLAVSDEELIDTVRKGFFSDDELVRIYYGKLRLGIDRPYCFHSLRHYSASYLHAIGIPDAYILERGGWSSPHIMQKVYRHALSDRVDPMAIKAVDSFQKAFQNA